ncbi:hypothetical protein [Palaeococcus ferrophilus]|uniref:hypothetical protein n=1 Tax=Palaeococcus ferrophilus TaxID=83868 RepID=UPI00064EE1D3|nr:hypothetical protein [Palaeococcus ferrophilus]
MNIAYKLAILPPIGAIITKTIITAGPRNDVTTTLAALVFVAGLLAYIGWFLYKTTIAGFYPEEKGTMLKAFGLYFVAFILSFVILLA